MQFEEDEVRQSDEDPEFTGAAVDEADDAFVDEDDAIIDDDDGVADDDDEEDDTIVADL